MEGKQTRPTKPNQNMQSLNPGNSCPGGSLSVSCGGGVALNKVGNNDVMEKLPPLPTTSTNSSNSGSGNKTSGGGGHILRLGGLSRYLMEKAQSNDSGLDLSPATLQTLVHPLRTSNSSTSNLHVRNLFESPASDESPLPSSNDISKNDTDNNIFPPTPHVSRSVLSEQSHNSTETTVIEKTITDESTSKDVTNVSKKEPLNDKVDNGIAFSVHAHEKSNPKYFSHTERTKQYYANSDNITPKDRIFHVPYEHAYRQDNSKTRISAGNIENNDPYASNARSHTSKTSHCHSQSNGNFSSEVAAVISTGASAFNENVRKSQGGPTLQTPKPKTSKKKQANPQSVKKPAGGWKFLSEHVQDKEFLILEQLGKGGCGEVSLVMEKTTRKQYALKIVQLHGIDDAAVQECINEVEMLIDLKGTDLVVDIHSWEFNRAEKTMKILMEKGQCDLNFTIQKANKTKKPIKMIKLKYIWESLLTIVDKIHSRGIVHADLKPANFVWFDDNLKIIDFGIASRLQSDLTSIAMANPKGTLNFISPEIIRADDTGHSKLSPKSDIWALGCILYSMVYGYTPFEHIGHAGVKVNKILEGDIVYPTLPPYLHGSEVISVLKLCFQIDYKRRPSAADLLKHRFLNT